jgi:uncharacterized membrane-anchored protein YitT (DUF2179 family)
MNKQMIYALLAIYVTGMVTAIYQATKNRRDK